MYARRMNEDEFYKNLYAFGMTIYGSLFTLLTIKHFKNYFYEKNGSAKYFNHWAFYTIYSFNALGAIITIFGAIKAIQLVL